jgi:DNA-binding NtrC family response regulator
MVGERIRKSRSGMPSLKREAAAEPGSETPPLAPCLATAVALPSGAALELLDANGHMRPLDAIEAEAIRFAIRHYGGQMSEVARRLHIGRSTLYRKLDSLGLDAPMPRAEMPAR